MGGDLTPGAVADTIAAEREREYHLIDGNPPNCSVCDHTVDFIVADRAAAHIDTELGFSDPDTLPTSEDVFPHISPDDPVTKQGLLDSLARFHPEYAAWLFLMCSEGGDLGAAYTFELVDAPQVADHFERELAQIDELIAEQQWVLRNLESIESQFGDGGMLPVPGSAYENIPGLDPGTTSAEAMHRLRELHARKEHLQRVLGRQGSWWGINHETRKIYASTWIDDDIDDPIPDFQINRAVTNRQAADWLKRHLEIALGHDEFLWAFIFRKGGGLLLMAIGIAEIVIGGTLLIGGSVTGVGAVAGGALLVTGWNALEAGARMWATPDRNLHKTSLDRVVSQLGTTVLGEERAYLADRGWAVTQILVGVGATTLVVRSGTTTRLTAPSLSGVSANMGRAAAVTVQEIKTAAGALAKYTRLPSLRGAEVEVAGLGKFLVKGSESDPRWLLRLQHTPVDEMVVRLVSRKRLLGAKPMTAAQRRAVTREAESYGAKTEYLSPRAFEQKVGNANAAAAFNPKTGTLYLRQDASHYEAFHELSHAKQWSELGPEAYGRLSKFEREQYVFNRIIDNANEFNDLQLGHAGNYIISEARRAGTLSSLKLPNELSADIIGRYRDYRGAPLSYDEILAIDKMY
ncbi:zincin-like metallopeptidase toxin domain-containing protein [Pseudaestuariivita rosea]|uniref:zincin-like metallopeptidase toxin domain-containing protein n=1 Tax=Pseudaestuariivita rosea TaxID=2763263 RepID=UPI001ABBB2C6|nr:zincin-like metallopeptidase toxin domain-containing protein [Pseudaestuariivita rosea]